VHATDAIRIIALRDVWLRHIDKADDADYNRRKIFRFYSSHFNTPLHVVETLPLLDVIRAYWEQNYEAMSEDDLEAVVRQAGMSDEDLKKLDDKDDASELDLDVIAAAVAAGAYGNLATSGAPAAPKPKPKGPRKSTLKEAEIAPKIDIKDLEKLPESISIKFSDDDDPDFDMEGDGLGLLEIPPSRASKS
jgi:hypothetical protein